MITKILGNHDYPQYWESMITQYWEPMIAQYWGPMIIQYCELVILKHWDGNTGITNKSKNVPRN